MNSIIDSLRHRNPFPEDIFLERNHADWVKMQKAMKKAGLIQDGYFGSFGRKVWNDCCDELEALLKGD